MEHNLKIKKSCFVSSSKTKNIKEDYEYIRELGSGGYGVVFLARNKITSNIALIEIKGGQSKPSGRKMSKTAKYLPPRSRSFGSWITLILLNYMK